MTGSNQKRESAKKLVGKTIDKYTINSYITSGGFGHVFIATVNDDSNRIFAIKIPVQSDNKKNYQKFLLKEYTVINEISNRAKGIMAVKLIEWKKEQEEKNYVMVMDLLGDSLSNYKKKWSLIELVKITIKMLETLRHIHSKGYLHRDIKPSNFVLHPSNDINDGVFCIDFGLAIKHPKEQGYSSFCGTETFASIAAHEGTVQSWKDDLESLVYCIIALHRNGLKWSSSSIPDKKERITEIGSEKQKLTPSTLCLDLPNEFKTLYKYTRSLSFGDVPKYKTLLAKFNVLLEDLQEKAYDPSYISDA
jgi:serine/threonine protein kinase